jgi:hypothetical protein
VPGFEDQVAQIVGLHKVHELLDSIPPNAKVLLLIDDGDKYRSARYGVFGMEDALWMIEAFKHSVLFPRVDPRDGG